jgi:hypothetical protein
MAGLVQPQDQIRDRRGGDGRRLDHLARRQALDGGQQPRHGRRNAPQAVVDRDGQHVGAQQRLDRFRRDVIDQHRDQFVAVVAAGGHRLGIFDFFPHPGRFQRAGAEHDHELGRPFDGGPDFRFQFVARGQLPDIQPRVQSLPLHRIGDGGDDFLVLGRVAEKYVHGHR